MANNPIDTNSFRHFLLIRGVETEISEPNNFNASNFKIVQDDIARDTFFGNEEAQLEFNVSFGYPTAPFMNNNGVLIYHLPSGAELLIEENKNYGNEADVKYILKKDNVSFTTGNIDFNKDYDSDNETYVKCRIIQNSAQALIKKREDITVDLLATTDLDDNPIDAIPIQRMLLKAKPTYGESILKNGETNYFIPFVGLWFFSPFQQVLEFGIDNTLSFLDTSVEVGTTAPFESFSLLEAVETLTDVNLHFSLSFTTLGPQPLRRLFIRSGTVSGLSNGTSIDIQDSIGFYSNEFTIALPNPINAGERLEVYFGGGIGGDISISNASVRITAISTGVDVVINAVRQIDLIKQTYKAIGSLPVNASIYDVGGKFYDNFCFNRNLIKQDITKPFYTKLEDVKEDLLEQCAFAQINTDEIFIGQYEDFYRNIDMGGFIEVPDYDASIVKNPKYLVNKFVFGYEKYEQDRLEKNTTDSIHTNSEWFVQANNSINKKEFKLPFIRDVFSIRTATRQVFSNDENSDDSDDNIFKVDVTALPPGYKSKIVRYLTYNIRNNVLKILTDGSFTWNSLGFSVGNVITVDGIDRTVLNITETILYLSATGSFGTASSVLVIEYPLTNVLYTNRTNEGLIFSENLRNSDNYGNLRYSIKRNIKNWYAVLATYGKFILNKKVKNTYFKSNGECITQFSGELEPIKENADILIADISEHKILSQDIYNTKIRLSFAQAEQLLRDVQNVRGFIRVQNPSGAIVKGYIKEDDTVWSTEEATLVLEIKNESDFLEVTFADGILTINEVGYDSRITDIKNYNIFNDYIRFFDNNSINLCNRTKFDKVSLNGVTYDNIDDLVNALENL